MAKVTKQLTDAEKIRNEILAVESAEEMKNEEKLLKRLIALQKKVDERNQRKNPRAEHSGPGGTDRPYYGRKPAGRAV